MYGETVSILVFVRVYKLRAYAYELWKVQTNDSRKIAPIKLPPRKIIPRKIAARKTINRGQFSGYPN